MSVDDRLRQAFAETDHGWDEHAPDALATVLARDRRETAVRRVATAALVAAAAVVAVVVAAPDDGDQSPARPSNPSHSQDVGSPNGPLEGRWTSGPITTADVRAAARAAGRPDVASAMLDQLPPRPFHITLHVTGTGLNQGFRSRQGDTTGDDVELLEFNGPRVYLRPRNAPGGTNVHTWVVEDGVLRMTFVSTTEADTEGVPGEAWQRLIYDTAGFTSGT